jgi:hypothetical protein
LKFRVSVNKKKKKSKFLFPTSNINLLNSMKNRVIQLANQWNNEFLNLKLLRMKNNVDMQYISLTFILIK